MKNTRGMRNNNPLNIRRMGKKCLWQGQREDAREKEFCVFNTREMGYRAAWILLDNYLLWFAQHGEPYCINSIINRWAPESENNTRAYINRVCKLTNIKGDEQLKAPFLDTEKFVKIIAAMTCVENGISMDEVPIDSIKEGFRLAFGNVAEI